MISKDPYASLKNACALVKQQQHRTTGFLIQRQQLLTVFYQGLLPSDPAGDVILLRFRTSQVQASVGSIDGQRKSARLKLETPLQGAEPLELSSECAHKDLCVLYGFPEICAPSGLLLTAVVLDPFGEDLAGEPALVLQLQGPSMPVSGLGGSPVVVNGKVVGLLHSILPDEQGIQAAGGILYATPIKRAVERLESDVLIGAHRRVPTAATLRRLIKKALPNMEDLDAFCHDYFFSIWERFTGTTSHIAKVTLLLDADRGHVLRCLERDPTHQTQVKTLIAELEFESEAAHT